MSSRRTTDHDGIELIVDWTRCKGHGVCAAAIGERITLDRWGFPDGVSPTGARVPVELRSAAKLAVATCPAVALHLRRPNSQ